MCEGGIVEWGIIVLAMAVACRPDILLLDEPTKYVRVLYMNIYIVVFVFNVFYVLSCVCIYLLVRIFSALDHSTTLLVENTIRQLGLSVVWATRDVFQAERVGDEVLIFNAITHVDLRAVCHSRGVCI